MKVLVTGGAGYVGTNLCEELLKQGHYVDVIDNLSTGRRQNVEHLEDHPRFNLYESDVNQCLTLPHMVEDADLVYHLAASVGVKLIHDDPTGTALNNVLSTRRILGLCHRHHKRILIVSSSEVYGRHPVGTLLSEDMESRLGPPTEPRWSYAQAKGLGEQMALDLHRREGLRVSIVRYFNSYGPWLHPSGEASVVARFIKQALAGEPIEVMGGNQTRCFAYVADTVRGTIQAATREEAIGHVFNIGSQFSTNILHLAERIHALTASSSEIVARDPREYYGDNYADPAGRMPDLTKSREILGYEPTMDLQQGLRRTIHWYKEHVLASEQGRAPLAVVG